VRFVPAGEPLPADADLIVLPGSKATLADLAFLRAQGWDVDILAARRRGVRVLGLCAGYQMLGRRIADPNGVEGSPGAAPGLGLLEVETVLTERKTLAQVRGTACGHAVHGYEMHIGVTDGRDCARAFVELDGRRDGAVSADGRVAGCYVHGLFVADAFRHAFLAGLHAGRAPGPAYDAMVEETLDRLADHLERHLDLDRLRELAG
jgi:adenosylcobyric acid synthase